MNHPNDHNHDHDHDQDQDQAAELGGAELLDQVLAALRRYVILPGDHVAAGVVLWIAASHGVPAWNAAPRLVIKAPEKRCGKSRLLDLTEALVHRPLMTTNASPTAVYRSLGEDPTDPPTLLLDEADALFGNKAGDHEDLRGLLNAGHQRGRPTLRWDAGTRQLERIGTFGMAALAGIGNMPDTIEDRAVIVHMRRRAPDESVEPYRARRDGPAFLQLKTQLHRWVRAHLDQLTSAAPAMPVEDRAADTWEPLVAVADLAGGHWPDTARQAVTTLTSSRDTEETVTLRVRLLMDCRAAFGPALALPTGRLLERLKADQEAPWATHGRDGLSAQVLSNMLRGFEIKSTNRRWEDGTQSKGYTAADFADAWRRYCPPDPEGDSPRPSRPSRPTPGQSGDDLHPWDDLGRPSLEVVPGPTRGGTTGTTGTAPPNTPTCITCRGPLTYDDGTHTHPTCASTERTYR